MVEAIVVISVFILFFVGMVYFESLYHEQLRALQLARAAAVAYAMDACPDNTDPLRTVEKDLHGASGSGSPQPTTSATVPVSANRPVGQGGDALGGAMQKSGFAGDKVTHVTVQGKAAGTTQGPGALSQRWGFRQNVVSNSYMSCGDPQRDGDPGGLWYLVTRSFPVSP
ncbi:MAG: hypothetical protein WBY94_29130 [Polyangiaceae bacterium]